MKEYNLILIKSLIVYAIMHYKVFINVNLRNINLKSINYKILVSNKQKIKTYLHPF